MVNGFVGVTQLCKTNVKLINKHILKIKNYQEMSNRD